MSPVPTPHVFTRAAALVAAMTITAVIVDVMAEIGHPPPNGFTVLNMLTPPASFIAAIVGSPAVVAQASQETSPAIQVQALTR